MYQWGQKLKPKRSLKLEVKPKLFREPKLQRNSLYRTARIANFKGILGFLFRQSF